MAEPHACPSRDDLQRLILNRLPGEAAQRIQRHVETCAKCRHALEQCLASDELLDAVRASRGPATDPTKTIYLPADWLGGALLTWIRAHDSTVAEKNALALSTDDIKRLLDAPQAPDEIGRVGDFRILRVLGVGGMAVVFEAVDCHLKRHAALKLMRPAVASKPGSTDRFLREAQSAAALKHEHIVTVYQVGMHGSAPFLAMELLHGESLDDRLKNGRPSIDEVLRIGREIAEALAAAHALGLLHRDIKPANIWLEQPRSVAGAVPQTNGQRLPGIAHVPGIVKILDFGCAKLWSDESGITHVGLMIGTPAYMAPEQLTGKTVDPRADLFSLGCVLYCMASGRPPFGGDNLLSVVRSLALEEPIPLAQLNPQIPQPLSDLVAQLLAKNADDRPASALAVVERLTVIEQQRRPAQRRETPDAPPSADRGAKSLRRRNGLVAIIGLALLVPFLSILFGAQLIRIVTNKGAIVVTIDDPTVGVTVAENQVVLHDGRGQAEITLAAGEHTLTVALKLPSGVSSFETEKFTLERGGKKIIQAQKELDRIAAASVAAPVNSAASIAAPANSAASIAARRDSSPKPPLSHADSHAVPTDPDRAAAAWTLSQGGFVDLRTEPGAHAIRVTSAHALPAGRFELTSVNLGGRPVTDADLERFHGLAHLIEFALNGAPVTDAGVAHLTDLPDLKNLALSNTRVTDAGLQSIGTLPKLEWLFLDGTPVTDAGLKHLKSLKNLTLLDLINTPITDAALVELAHLPKLGSLLLQRTRVTDLGLARIRGVSHLRELDLSRLPISDAGLANVRDLSDLRSLWLSETRITDVGLASVAHLPHLDTLFLENTVVTDNGLVALERIKNLKQLSVRGLHRIDDSAIPKLVHLQSLLKLDIRDCHVSASGVATLRSALPGAQIQWSEPNDAAAKYVLEAHGTIDVILDAGAEKRHIKAIADVPTQPFRLVGVQLAGTHSPLYQSIMAMKNRGLDGLVSIDFSNTVLDDGDVDRLQSPPTVRALSIAGTHVTDKCLAYLKGWQALERLNITVTAIHGSGLMHLQSLPVLHDLYLGGPNVNELFLVELSGLKLERLGLSKCTLSTHALKTLAQLTQLRELDLCDIKLAPKQLADLQKALPNCRVTE
jgi:eukaryotic-like serine/threonine-protein kinase